MKKIAIITATRAEYGLLAPVIRELRTYENEGFRVEVIVTGTHLYTEYGDTIQEIKADHVRIDEIIEIPVNSQTALDISSNQAVALTEFTELFLKKRYDAVMLLGDRYETLAFAIAAGNTQTPIFHLAGGDTTEGAMDEWIRHSITKMSYLHFTTNEQSRRRVIQMGENPNRVFNYGSTSIDNIMMLSNMTRQEALESVGLSDCRYALCTYHPTTMELEEVDAQVEDFLRAIEHYPNIQFIVTKSNSDQGGSRINNRLDSAEKKTKNLHVYASLGAKRYLSLMRYAEFVLGNSSSGIIETPAFHIPTVNIGDRQRGRLQTQSIINCDTDEKAIVRAIGRAISAEMKQICEQTESPYGDGVAAKKIAKKSVEIIMQTTIDLRKTFYDIEV